ncbi:MAG: formylmethanofuran dehydrogenase [Desulfobulbaceae bacterium]|nr:formylmethanofuran dehydrogenase [Desulfobulbaceae bacterium]
MKSFQELLKESVSAHGHICAGQVLGVRMAILGCHLVGIENPKDKLFRKKLIVYVEIDRCATDAIASVTGCQLGKRTMKFKDFGINAATFVNLDTRIAYRIISTENSREYAHQYAPEETTLRQQQIVGYQHMPDSLLFDVQRVQISLPENDMPGPPKHHTICDCCGQIVRDGKEIQCGNETLCRPCSDKSYFKIIDPQELSQSAVNFLNSRGL